MIARAVRPARARGIRPAAGARGVTLIEVTLALMLFGILAVFLVGIVDSVLQLWQTGERRGRGDLVFAAATERFRDDLAAMHTGPRGWMVLDDWEARPATEERMAWTLPRLRFLAHGAALPADDPTGRQALEVCWALVPEDAEGRLTRLVRLVQPESAASSFAEDSVARAALRGGEGLVVLDGVAWARFTARDTDGAASTDLRVPAEQPFDFPSSVRLEVERVGGTARERPPTLDRALGTGPDAMPLRGTPPPRLPDFALIGDEWLGIAGRFPRLSATKRAERGTLAEPHPAGATVWLPQRYESVNPVAAGGRRLR